MKNHTTDFYEVLGIALNATPKEIRIAHRKAAILYHPDKTNGDKAATARFLVIQKAYEVLTDPKQRKDYDTRCYPGIQRSRSGGSKRAREQPTAADSEAPSRSMPRPKKPRRKDPGSAWYEDFEFDEAFIESLAERERQFMHDWNENESRRAHSLMSTAQDMEAIFADIQYSVAVAKVSNRHVRKKQAGIDDGLGKETYKVWSAGFSAHLDELVQSLWHDEHPLTSLVTTLCSKIIEHQSSSSDVRTQPEEWPADRGPEGTMEDDAQRLETLMPEVLRAWCRAAKTQRRIDSEVQMLHTDN